MAISRCNLVGARLMLGIALMIVSYMMLTPRPPQPEFLAFWQADKLAHMCSFLLLSLLADAGWAESGFGPRKYLPLLAYGIVLEGLQHFVPGAMSVPGTCWPTPAGSCSMAWRPCPYCARPVSADAHPA